MKHANAILISGLVLWTAACASAPKGAPAESSDSSATGQAEARKRAPTDVNKEEFLWNNDFGSNDFLYEPR